MRISSLQTWLNITLIVLGCALTFTVDAYSKMRRSTHSAPLFKDIHDPPTRENERVEFRNVQPLRERKTECRDCPRVVCGDCKCNSTCLCNTITSPPSPSPCPSGTFACGSSMCCAGALSCMCNLFPVETCVCQ